MTTRQHPVGLPTTAAGSDAAELERLRAENAALRARVRELEGARREGWAPADETEEAPVVAARLRGDDERLAAALEALERPAEAAGEERLLRELREAVDARDAFLSVASHELKTPLTTLGLIADGLERGVGAKSPEDLALRARRLRRQVDRLDRLVGQLIDVSEMASGRLELHPVSTDLAALVRAEAEAHREHLARSGTELRVAVPRALPGRWDETRVTQVVCHLLHNAGKYGRGRPVEVRLDRGARFARLEVVDQGIGIAPGDQRRIFERFERAVTTRHYGGLGLGLWLTRRLVEAMGGEIHVWSRPREGARFTIYLPLEPAGPGPARS